MNKLTKATSISPKVKRAVWERDNHLCIFCRKPGDPIAHIVRRSQGGLGIERNVVTACQKCHREFDEGHNRETMYVHAISYLKCFYPDWNREDMIYRKGENP